MTDLLVGVWLSVGAVLLIQTATAIAAEAEAPRSFAVDLPTDGVVYGQRGDGRLGRH